MLLDFEEAIQQFNMNVTAVLHVGCHLAEEAPIYGRLDVPVFWVEANEDLRDKIDNVLQNYPKQELLIGFAVTNSEASVVNFNITNYDSMSSSVFEFGTHPTFSPDTVFVDHRMVPTITLDYIKRVFEQEHEWFADINTLVMDIQGAELLALIGATEFLKQVDYIYCEVNTAEVYLGCAQLDQLIGYLPEFELVATHMVGNQGWGDGLFIRKEARV